MLPANAAFRDARLAKPEGEMIFRRAAIGVRADDYRRQAIKLDDVSSLKCAHGVKRLMTPSQATRRSGGANGNCGANAGFAAARRQALRVRRNRQPSIPVMDKKLKRAAEGSGTAVASTRTLSKTIPEAFPAA